MIIPNLKFQILNEGLTRNQIDEVVSCHFNGKEDFIRFYLTHDGIYFPDGAVVSTEQFLTDDEDEYYELEIEFIYNMEHLTKMWAAIRERSAYAKKFAETHFPFARDAAGNVFFIEIPTGIVKYISWEYDFDEGIIDVAANFKEFCRSIQPLV